MIPTNEENVSSHAEPVAHTPAAFDPTTTSDPLPSGYSRPAIGYGTTTEFRFRVGDRQKYPIGFAPEVEPEAPRLLRTEISFRRHTSVVAAGGSTGSLEGAPAVSWGTTSTSERPVESSRETPKSGAQPFYKRELSFRRRRTPRPEIPVLDEDPYSAADQSTDVVQSGSADAEAFEGDVQADASHDVEPVVEDLDPVADASDSASVAASEESPQAYYVSESNDLADEPAAEASDEASDEEQLLADADDRPAAEVDEPAAEADDPIAEVGEPAAEAAEPPAVPVAVEHPAKPGKNGKARRRRGGRGRTIVGLKIGATQLAAAVVAETDDGRELVQLARRPLDTGIVVDGEVRDRDALARALKSFFHDEDLPRRDVRLGVGSNRIGVRIFDIVGVEDEARFDNAVRFKAHEVLPVAVHESALDYRVLSQRLTEDGQVSRRVLLVVAPRDHIDPLVDVAGRAGLGVLGVDLEALGLLRTFVEPVPSGTSTINDTATVLVAIGHESSTLLVASDGLCEFTRVFDWGGNVLNEAIAQELQVLPAEAATILRHLSLSGPGRQMSGLDDAARASAVSVVRNRLTPFARELVNSLQFYQSQPDSLGIGGIVITGGTSHLEGLDQALNQIIGVGVTVGDPLGRVVVRHELDADIEASIGSLAVPIGLAIDDAPMRGVDLSERGSAKPRRKNRSTLVAIGVPVAAAIPLIALGALYVGAHGTASSRSAELAQVQTQIAALPKPTGPSIDPSMGGSEAQRAMGVANILGGRIAWERLFREVSRVLPENVWLDTMTANSPGETSPAVAAAAGAASTTAAMPATDVTLTGATFSQVDVARLLARLATLPSLDDVRLVSASAQDTKNGTKTIQFNIAASMNTTGGAS